MPDDRQRELTRRLFMGLYGGLGAPGAQDEIRRRRGGPASGGIGGPEVTANQLRAYVGGSPQWDYSGPMARDFAGRGGLAAYLAQELQGGGGMSPALRHFQNQGFNFMPPGQDQREGPGGPNIAPGNIDDARALYQPRGNLTPGVPQGVAYGYDVAPGQGAQPRPQTQGWRNVAPGYSAAAQFGYGTDEFGRNIGMGGGRSAPGAQVSPPAGQPGGRPGGSGGPGGAGGGGSQNPIGGGPGPVAPAAGGGVQGGGQGSGNQGGGGGGGQAPAGVTPQVKQQAAGQSTARGGLPQQQVADQRAAGNIAKGAGGKNLGGSPMLDALGAIQDLGNQPKPPNGGNNNTPSELSGGMPDQGKLAGMSPQEKAKAKAAWQAKVAAKQERQRQAVAQRSGQYAAPDSRGTGTDPINNNTPSETRPYTPPKAGKTKPKPGPSSRALQAKRS